MKIISSFVACLLTGIMAAQITVSTNISHIIPDGAHTTGSITLAPSGSTSPYSYTWSPGSTHASSITAATAGSYTVNIKSASSATVTKVYSIGYKASWTNANQITIGHDTIKSVVTTDGYATVSSQNTLRPNENGWFEFVIKATTNTVYLGFLDSLSLSSGVITDIDYGFYLDGAAHVLYSLGDGTNTLTSSPAIGDVIRLERSGNVLTYKINNASVKTLTVTGLGQKSLKLKAGLDKTGYTSDVGCSFIHLDSTNFPGYLQMKPAIIQNRESHTTNGSISLTPRVTGTYTYTWLPGATTVSAVASQGNGSYSVTIRDNLANQNTYVYNVGYKTGWAGLYSASLSNDTLLGTVTNSYSAAYSKNVIPAGSDGSLEYSAVTVGKIYYIGFADSIYTSTPTTTSDIDYGYYLNVVSGKPDLYTIESSSVTLINIAPRTGDIMRIERIKDTIFYKINSTVFSRKTVTGISGRQWMAKFVAYNKGGIANLGMSRQTMELNNIATQDIACVPSQTTGSVSVSPTGGKSPVTYTFDATSTGTVSTKTGLTAGTHTVQAADADGYTTSQTYTVWQCPVWTTTTTPLTINTHGDVIKSGGVNGWDDGYLLTSQVFRFKDTAAWISFDVADTISSYVLGFRSVDGDTVSQTSNYKMYVEHSKVTLLETDNDGFYNKMDIARVTAGTHIKIQFCTAGIQYFISPNKDAPYDLVYTSRLYGTVPMIVEAILNKTSSRINTIRVSGNGN